MIKKIIIILIVVLLGFGWLQSKNRQAHIPPSNPPADVSSNPPFSSDAEVITVHAARTFSTPVLQGFLNGVGVQPTDVLDSGVVGELKPKFWRISDFAHYDKVKPFHPAVTFIVGEQYVNSHGGWDKVRPWEHWQEWEDSVRESVKYSLSTNRPVAYWDIWGEPDLDGGTIWNGTYAQFLEFVARGYRVIHALDANAKVIGPSVSQFKPRFHGDSGEVTGLDTFIKDLATIHNVKLEGISWHELGSDPEDVPVHAKELRSFLHKTFPGYNPEFHVNEFSAQNDHLIPGWTVAWLYYLEKADISVVNRACWNVKTSAFKSWSDCWQGMNGLLLDDTKTPQHIYWVHKAYADLARTRITTESANKKVVALASRNDLTKELRVIIGRYATRGAKRDGPLDTTVNIDLYPYSEKRISVVRAVIPSVPTPGPFAKPKQDTVPFTVSGTTLSIPLTIHDGDAIELVIRSSI